MTYVSVEWLYNDYWLCFSLFVDGCWMNCSLSGGLCIVLRRVVDNNRTTFKWLLDDYRVISGWCSNDFIMLAWFPDYVYMCVGHFQDILNNNEQQKNLFEVAWFRSSNGHARDLGEQKDSLFDLGDPGPWPLYLLATKVTRLKTFFQGSIILSNWGNGR